MSEDNRRLLSSIGSELKVQIMVLGGLIAFMWLLEVIDLLPVALDSFGVRPRTMVGLRNILFAPFLHVGFGHLIANTAPFLVLGWFVMMQRMRDFVFSTILITIISGLGIWLFGASNSVHLGASSLIFGYFGFLLLRGYFERSTKSIVLSVVVAVLYGGLIFGVLPQGGNISWEGHLFGFIGGILAAYFVADRARLSTGESVDDQIRILDN